MTQNIRLAAARRLMERRQPAGTTTRPDGATESYGERYEPPATLAEWCDDQLVLRGLGQYRGPFSEVTAAVLEAARTAGTDAAVKALGAARRLTPADQFRLTGGDLQQLRDAANVLPDAARLTDALTREARRLRLADGPPAFAEIDEDPLLAQRDKPRPGSERLQPVDAGAGFARMHGLA